MDADRKLIERVLAGERRAFLDFVMLHERLVRHVVMRLIPDPRDREEIAQDVFLRAHRNLSSFAFEAKLSTWIAKIAYRSCLNHLARRGVRELPAPEKEWQERHENLPDGAISQLSALERAEAVRFLRDRISALPAAERAAVTLHHLDGLSMVEIAGVMEIPAGTVKSHLFRARRRLKDLLAGKIVTGDLAL